MAYSKRDSRLRRLLRRLGGRLRSWHPHRKYKSGYLEPTRVPSHLRGQARKEQLASRNEQPLQTSGGSKRAMPSSGKLRTITPTAPPDDTIRVVSASTNSRARTHQEERPPQPIIKRKEVPNYIVHAPSPARKTYQESEEGRLKLVHPAPVLSWQESARTQHLIERDMSDSPSSFKNDSGVEMPLEPSHGRCAPLQVKHAHTPAIAQPMTITKMKPTTVRPSNRHFVESAKRPKPTFTSVPFEPVPGWEYDWDKPLQHRIGNDKGIFRSTSNRLVIRNKDSIRVLDEEQIRRQMRERMEIAKRETPQMRSFQSIEEMAEEDRRADEEWGGIAAQLAAESQSPGIQKVGSFSFGHGKHVLAAEAQRTRIQKVDSFSLGHEKYAPVNDITVEVHDFGHVRGRNY